MPKNPQSKNLIPAPLQFLTLKELFIFTGIPLHLLEGISKGEFKPKESDRRKISIASMPFYKFNRVHAQAFVQRRKFRTIRRFITPDQRDELFSEPEQYEKKLDAIIEKNWDKVVAAVTEKTS